LYLEKKGQISAEFLFITFIVLIVMAGMLSLVTDGMDKTSTADMAKARVVGEKFASAINAVYVAGSGYSANFTISGDLTDPASTFTINDATNTVDVAFNGKTVKIRVVPTSLTSFTVTSASADKVITISNQNGTIKFT